MGIKFCQFWRNSSVYLRKDLDQCTMRGVCPTLVREGRGRGGEGRGEQKFLSIDQQLHVESMVGRPGTTIF